MEHPSNTAFSEDIQIRTHLQMGDLGYIAYLHGVLYEAESAFRWDFDKYVLAGLAEFAMQYDETRDRVWICTSGEKIIGSLVAFARPEGVQIRFFILAPEARGRGLGKKLMEEFMCFLKEKRYPRAFLLTGDEQKAAIALYLRCGFVLVEEKEIQTFGRPFREQRYELLMKD